MYAIAPTLTPDDNGNQVANQQAALQILPNAKSACSSIH
jgi:hypothetical protein